MQIQAQLKFAIEQRTLELQRFVTLRGKNDQQTGTNIMQLGKTCLLQKW